MVLFREYSHHRNNLGILLAPGNQGVDHRANGHDLVRFEQLVYQTLTDNSYSGYNQPGHRGIPHTRVTKAQLAAVTAVESAKSGQTEHHEEV